MLKTTTSIINASQIAGVLPVVNGGTGVTTSTGTGSTVLSAAPTLSGNVTLSTGNLIVASGQGIDFSATSGTGTSELLNDYEEGTWTGTFTASVTPPLTPITTTGIYTKIGRQVTVIIEFSAVDTTGAVGAMLITGLPFTSAASPIYNVGTVGKFQLGALVDIANVTSSSTTINIVDATTTGGSVMLAGPAKYIFVSVTYIV